MATALRVLQTTFYNQLAGNVTNGGEIVPVYDFIPDESPYPYIAIGEATEVQFPGHWDTQGKEVTATIHVWSSYRGMSEVLNIMDGIDTQLDLTNPTAVGWNIPLLRLEFRQTLVEFSGVRHGISRYRVIINNS